MSAFSIGLSGLRVSQRLIDLTGQNIANAGTPDYHRQVALLAARTVGSPIGTGVEILKLGQVRNGFIESALLQSQTDLQSVTSRLDLLRRVETTLDPGDGSAHDLLENLFNQIDQLAANPGDVAQRRVVLGTASELADKLSSLTGDIQRMIGDVNSEASQTVDEINRITPQIAALNEAIQQATIRGDPASDLLDQRTTLINNLAELANIRTIDQDFGQQTVILAGQPVVLGNQATPLELFTDSQDQLQLAANGTGFPLDVLGGKLAGLLELRNQLLPSYQDRIDTLAHELIGKLDGLQATGLGLNGPLTILAGERAVKDATIPLAQAQLSFPPQAGVLSVSVTEQTTGTRTLTRISVDPSTQSLQDLAAALNGVSNLTAVVDTQTNTLKVLAGPGYAFDFAGRLPTAPDTAAITGTTTPQIGGSYSGTGNDTYTFRISGSGTVGVTPNLTLETRTGAGNLIASQNIGQGYSPRSALPPINGVNIGLALGTANDGDTFTVPVTSNADTSGILTALGLNTLFTGDDANGFSVRADLAAHPEDLAAGLSGLPGDGTNLARMSDLRDQKLFGTGTQNFREFYASLTGDVGQRVQDLSLRQTAQQGLQQNLQDQRQSISGVDPNEELVRLLEFQRSFQTSARYISAVNDSLDELMKII